MMSLKLTIKVVAFFLGHPVYANLLILQKQHSLAGQIDKLRGRIRPAAVSAIFEKWPFVI